MLSTLGLALFLSESIKYFVADIGIIGATDISRLFPLDII
jgi:hypothetical protein